MTKSKLVLKVSVHDDRGKKKAMVIVSRIGVDSISMDMKEQKMTIVGDLDAAEVVSKLRKSYQTEMVSLEPIKPTPVAPKKPEEKKKEDEHVKKCVSVNPPYHHFYAHPPPVTHFTNYHPCPEEQSACVIC